MRAAFGARLGMVRPLGGDASTVGSGDGGAEWRLVLAGKRSGNQRVLGRGGERCVDRELRRDPDGARV